MLPKNSPLAENWSVPGSQLIILTERRVQQKTYWNKAVLIVFDIVIFYCYQIGWEKLSQMNDVCASLYSWLVGLLK